MSTISPGPASNAQMTANVQYEGRAQDPYETGHEVTLSKGANASAAMAAHSFEARVASDPGH
jgi:hypothetical protein